MFRITTNACLTALSSRSRRPLPSGSYESVDSAHLIQAEQPLVVGTRIRQLLDAGPR
jgi:hypothetical protein